MGFIDQILGFLTDKMGPLGPLIAVGILGALLILISLPIMLNRKADPFEKLQSKKPAKQDLSGQDTGQQLRFENKGEKLDKYATFLEPQDEVALSAARKKLIEAGYRSKGSVRTFHFMQFVLAVGFMMLGIIFVLFRLDVATLQSTLINVILPAGAGYYLPTYWVERRRQTRHGALQDGFPDALDLMLVCVEAGQSLDQSIQRVAAEIEPAFPELSEEFEIVSNEMKAGKDRVSVLRGFGERSGSQDIASFTTVMIQSATFGTSISEALRVYGAEMRDKRVMRAEEMANKLPTKLTLGTMMFTLPPLLVILIGPSIFNIYILLLGGGQ